MLVLSLLLICFISNASPQNLLGGLLGNLLPAAQMGAGIASDIVGGISNVFGGVQSAIMQDLMMFGPPMPEIPQQPPPGVVPPNNPPGVPPMPPNQQGPMQGMLPPGGMQFMPPNMGMPLAMQHGMMPYGAPMQPGMMPYGPMPGGMYGMPYGMY